MSKEIRRYESIKDGFPDVSDMEVTAFVGGEYGHAIQFTTKNNYVCLSEKQLLDLILVILKRLNSEEGYTATEARGEVITVLPGGELKQ